jgi:GNAT superfamily N-acetyltransferase
MHLPLSLHLDDPIVSPPSISGSNITITPLLPEDLSAVSHLTFPSYRSLLKEAVNGTNEKILALVARSKGIPVGLVLAEPPSVMDNFSYNEKKNALKLFSVMTDPEWRRRSIATALLQALTQQSRYLGYLRLITGYTTKIKSLVAFEHLLASSGWDTPIPSMELSIFRIGDMETASWLDAVSTPPPGYKLFPLNELTDKDRVWINAGIATGEIPEYLSPFAEEEYLVPEISVGLRYGRDIVAWMTLIRAPLVADALCYRTLFVHPKLRTTKGFGPLVAATAGKLHAASPIRKERPKGIFGTSFHSIKQLNFARKRLNPHCFEIYESRKALCNLQP